ncbi:MAG: acyl-CoA dehydrogenase family protein [Chloroflexi bacterium]|nr:acyl-CoA dehydrogenase family protein [Chloroflexota bacterium]
MDFELNYSAEQEAFRNEVRTWLNENLPAAFEESVPPDQQDYSQEHFAFAREFRKKLGSKGWLAPTWPKEQGGGGLTVAHQIVLEEELGDRHIPAVGDLGLTLGAPAINAWGNEEQKQRFLPPILKGEIVVWQVFTEPGAGSDLASLRTRAVEDGDDFVLNGNKIFVGQKYTADYLYTLAVTDPEAPRHQNIGAFIIPAETAGVTVHHLDLIAGGGKRAIFFDDVRVPKANMLGGKGQGWWVAQTTLELEHGGGGRVSGRNRLVDMLIDYCRDTERGGNRLGDDPDIRRRLTELYIRAERSRLIGLRNYWQRNAGVRQTYEGSQFSLTNKMFMPDLATAMLEILGPSTLIKDNKWKLARGEFENWQRQSTATHPGGTPEVQKVIMARSMGLSRGREAARPGAH